MHNFIEQYIKYLQFEKRYSLLTVQQYKTELLSFQEFIQNNYPEMTLESVELPIIQSYLFSLHETQTKRTRAKKLSILRGFYQYLLFENIIQKNPTKYIEQPRKEKKLPEILTTQEVNLLVEQVKESHGKFWQRDVAIMLLLFGSGLRVSELISLHLCDINMKEQLVFVSSGKGNKQRYVPMSKYSMRYLEQYLYDLRENLMLKNKEPHDFVFVNKSGAPITARGIQYILTKISQTSEVHAVTPHMFRHSFATSLLDGGADLKVVQELLGHESVTSTQIYTHVSQGRLQEVYNGTHPLANKINNGRDKINNGK